MPTAYAPLDEEEGKWYFHAYLHDPMYSWESCGVRMRVERAAMDCLHGLQPTPLANAYAWMKMHFSLSIGDLQRGYVCKTY